MASLTAEVSALTAGEGGSLAHCSEEEIERDVEDGAINGARECGAHDEEENDE